MAPSGAYSPAVVTGVTIMLADLADRAEVTEAYARRFAQSRLPARMTVEAGAVPPAGASLEIQAIAARADRTPPVGPQGV